MASSLHKHTQEELHLVSLRSRQQRYALDLFHKSIESHGQPLVGNLIFFLKIKRQKNTVNTIRFHHTDPTDDCDNFIKGVPDS